MTSSHRAVAFGLLVAIGLFGSSACSAAKQAWNKTSVCSDIQTADKAMMDQFNRSDLDFDTAKTALQNYRDKLKAAGNGASDPAFASAVNQLASDLDKPASAENAADMSDAMKDQTLSNHEDTVFKSCGFQIQP
ncbi:hypothetical protein ABIA39_005073 [Nocardia sp. GAS34]|uniref:hypothetical protein n=1 Tax=unclassified Nocardia TaxID=2637762 RepID=UPI003D2057E6